MKHEPKDPREPVMITASEVDAVEPGGVCNSTCLRGLKGAIDCAWAS
jgi:hypothetical protein